MEHAKELREVVLRYKDGTQEVTNQVMVSRIVEDSSVTMQICGLEGPEVLTIMGALQGVLNSSQE